MSIYPEVVCKEAACTSIQEGAIKYSAYLKDGGTLPQSLFDKFQTLEDTTNSDGSSGAENAPQALKMAKDTGVELSPHEVAAYAHFRKIMREDGDAPQGAGTGQLPVWSLSDQQLLAEVILMGGNKSTYDKFTSFYPNIFPKEQGV